MSETPLGEVTVSLHDIDVTGVATDLWYPLRKSGRMPMVDGEVIPYFWKLHSVPFSFLIFSILFFTQFISCCLFLLPQLHLRLKFSGPPSRGDDLEVGASLGEEEEEDPDTAEEVPHCSSEF